MIDPINLKGTEVFDILEQEWNLDDVITLAEELEVSAGYTDKYDIDLFYTEDEMVQINIDTEYIFLTMEVAKDGSMNVYVGHDDCIMRVATDWLENIAVIVKCFYLFCFNDIDVDVDIEDD